MEWKNYATGYDTSCICNRHSWHSKFGPSVDLLDIICSTTLEYEHGSHTIAVLRILGFFSSITGVIYF